MTDSTTAAEQTVSTAEELRTAAAKIREMAAAARAETMTGSGDEWLPWFAVRDTVGADGTAAVVRPQFAHDHEEAWYETAAVADDLPLPVAEWVALTNPVLAEPLAAWLEWAAGIARDHPWDPSYDGMPDMRWCTHCQDEETSCVQAVDRALAVARVVNGASR